LADHVDAVGEVIHQGRLAYTEVTGDGIHLEGSGAIRIQATLRKSFPQAKRWHQDKGRESVSQNLVRRAIGAIFLILPQLVDGRTVPENAMPQLMSARESSSRQRPEDRDMDARLRRPVVHALHIDIVEAH